MQIAEKVRIIMPSPWFPLHEVDWVQSSISSKNLVGLSQSSWVWPDICTGIDLSKIRPSFRELEKKW